MVCAESSAMVCVERQRPTVAVQPMDMHRPQERLAIRWSRKPMPVSGVRAGSYSVETVTVTSTSCMRFWSLTRVSLCSWSVNNCAI